MGVASGVLIYYVSTRMEEHFRRHLYVKQPYAQDYVSLLNWLGLWKCASLGAAALTVQSALYLAE